MNGDMKIKVSVIIPVYNVEDYIERCIESLRAQLLDGLEFIFVDDCSSDGSMEAVKAWAAEDGRVRILRNGENLGAGPSRNRGIDAARGEYLSFVDPDDYVSPDFYQLLYCAATEDGSYDISKGSCQMVDPTGTSIASPSRLNNLIAKRIQNGAPLFSAFTYDHWTALYRHSLFDGGVRYGTTRNGQDTTFLLRCCYQTESITFNESAVYFYVQREGSATYSGGMRRANGDLDSLVEKAEFLIAKGIGGYALEYLLGKTCTYLRRFQELLGEGRVKREDYGDIAERVVEITRSVPGMEAACDARPQLKEILSGCPLTTCGRRSPGEGDIRISVVIPVYNVANYIDRCIESLRAQLLDGLEFIFVDDCSTDGSMEEVEAWAAEDERVRILRNDENIGAGPSRNRGIEAARGDYLSFVDPDDYISPDFYQVLYAAASEGGGHDIAKGVCRKVDCRGASVTRTSQMNARISKHLSQGRPLYTAFTYEHWSAIYRQSLFTEDIRYGLSRNGEDTTFLLRCCRQTNDITFVNSVVYYYVQRPGSAIGIDGRGRTFHELEMLQEMVSYLRKQSMNKSDIEYLLKRLSETRRRFQELLGEGRVGREDYAHVAERLAEIIRSVPGIEEACDDWPRLKEILSGSSLTKPGKRSPGEGDVRISVVIPVYNVETYINRCIESLRAQLLDGLEFIFVDDCSADGSMQAVEAWAAEDERVRILRNDKNLGAGPSRNCGIEAARGEYLSFIDPDDYISLDFYQLLYAAAIGDDGHDIAKGTCKKVDNFGTAIAPTSQLNARIAECQKEGRPLFVTFSYEHWTAIYHKSVFADNSVRYGTSCNDQDTTFQLAYTLQTNRIALEENAIYYYVKRPGSVFETVSPERFMGELDSLKEKAVLLQDRNSDYYAQRYLTTKLNVYLTRFFSWSMKSHTSEGMFADYTCKLMEIVENSPALHFLQSRSLVYRALVEHGALLPSVSFLPEEQKVDGALAWLYFIRDNSITETEYIEICASASVTALQQLANARGWHGFRAAYSQLMKGLETLPVKQRTAIWIKVHHRLATKRNAKAFLRKLKRYIGRD